MAKPKHEMQSPSTAPATQKAVTDKDLRRHAQDLGMLGNFLGGATEKPGNIAWTAIAGAFAALLLILFFGPDSPTFPKSEAVTLFGGIITGALGFVFGRTTSS